MYRRFKRSIGSLFFALVLTGTMLLAATSTRAQELKFANLGALKLESGETLKDCRVGYRTFGRLNEDRSNAILLLTWFNGKSKDLETSLAPMNFWIPLNISSCSSMP